MLPLTPEQSRAAAEALGAAVADISAPVIPATPEQNRVITEAVGAAEVMDTSSESLQSPRRSTTAELFSSPASNSSHEQYTSQAGRRFMSKLASSSGGPAGVDAAFVVAEDKLRALFRHCQECGALFKKELNFSIRGAHVRVWTFCDKCDQEQQWHSFSEIGRMSQANLALVSATITAGNTYEDLQGITSGCKLAIPCKTEYYSIACSYVYPAIAACYQEKNAKLLSSIREEQQRSEQTTIDIAMDTRYSRPGHTAWFATTSAIDVASKKVLASITTMKLVDAPSAPALKAHGTKIVLDSLLVGNSDECLPGTSAGVDSGGIRIRAVVTDDHSSIIKMMSRDYGDIIHQGDVWHFAKRVKKQLVTKAKLVSYRPLAAWIESITNLIWTICQECHGDAALLEELWASILNHVVGVHSWPSDSTFQRVHSCLHAPLSPEKAAEVAWLNKSSRAYIALQKIITDPKLITSLWRCSQFLHISELESFHSALLKFVPKRLAFEKEAFMARTSMAIMNFNENIGRPIRVDATGQPRTRLELPMCTGTWTAKADFVAQTAQWRDEVMARIFTLRQDLILQFGHCVCQPALRMEPTQRSFVTSVPREILDEQFKKRRQLD